MARDQIAQLNIGRTVAPLDDPRLADFMAWLEDVDALAERSPGFVWRLQGSRANATDEFARMATSVPVPDFGPARHAEPGTVLS